MSNFLRFMIIFAILFGCQSFAFSQYSPTPPPVRNYQEYLIMMKALNDVNREKGLPSVKPLNKKEWERLWPEGGPDAPRKQKVTVSKKDNEKELLDAAFKGETEKVNQLLNERVNPEARASDGGTPLMYAALKGHIDTIKALIEKGAKPNARDKNRCTALMQAAYGGHLEVVKFLLKAGADPNAIAKDGTTALKWAELKGYNDVAVILQNAGAKR
jgi:ankyrin repeat protein